MFGLQVLDIVRKRSQDRRQPTFLAPRLFGRIRRSGGHLFGYLETSAVKVRILVYLALDHLTVATVQE